MQKTDSLHLSRRNLITKLMPACAATCFTPWKLFGMGKADNTVLFQEEKHPFDTELEGKMTYRQLFQRQYFNTVQFGKLLKQELGDQKAIELIKRLADTSGREIGKRQAKQFGENSLQAFVKQFKDPKNYQSTLKMDIVEDTGKAFELKVHECLWAETFRAQDAGDIGFAWICFADYSWPEGFNSKMKMIRDKTLMEGHDYCNHRYVIEV